MNESKAASIAFHPRRLARRLAGALLACATGLALAYALVRPNPGRTLFAERRAVDARFHALVAQAKALEPLHARKGEPKRTDWLYVHPEPGQSPRQYVERDAMIPEKGRRRILVLPLGDFTPERREIVDLASEFLGLYFGLPSETLPPASDSIVPNSARRYQGRDFEQLSAPHIIDEILIERLPDDAMLLTAFTAKDLWPGLDNWNFVFGQASLFDRVGVWSIHRFGDPAWSADAKTLALRRSLKLAAHESGHMFGLKHCAAYDCCMNGSNSLEESDRGPLALCPECLVKVAWATGVELEARFEKLRAFCERNGLQEERDHYQTALDALRAAPAAAESEPAIANAPEAEADASADNDR